MDEKLYLQKADRTFRRLLDAFESVDPDLVEADTTGDVVTLTFADRSKCVINTQRPTRQIWLAANARGWHFRYAAESDTWVDDKGRGDELFATVTEIVRGKTGLALSFAP